MILSKRTAIYLFIFSAAAFFCSQVLIWQHYFIQRPVNYFDASYHSGLAAAHVSSGDIVEAEAEFRKALRLNPTGGRAHYSLANFYAHNFNKTKLNQAYDEYNKAMLFSSDKERLDILEDVYSGLTQDYALLGKIVPRTGRARHTFAEFLRDKKLYDKAVSEFKQAIVLAGQISNNNILADSYNWIAIIYMWQNKFEPAVEYFNKALDCAQRKVYKSWVFRNLGNTYLNAGDLNKAKEAYENAVKNDPRQWINYHRLGDVYEKMGLKKEAEYYYQRALKFKPDSKPVRD